MSRRHAAIAARAKTRRLTMPCVDVARGGTASRRMPNGSPSCHAPDQHQAPSRVLVVDDEVLIRLTIADYLRDCGLHVLEAADGVEAMTILQAADMEIDLVFSDIQMPRMDGFSLARWIRENRPRTKVLLASGHPAKFVPQAVDLCHEGPIEQKPYDHAALLRRIREMLARAGRQ